MKKIILILLSLAITNNVFSTKRVAIDQLEKESKKLKLNHKLQNTINTSNSLLDNIENEKIVAIIKKYVSERQNTVNFLPTSTFKNDDQVWIYEAIKNKDYKKASNLIDNNIDSSGYTPLTKAVIKNDIEAVKIFIKLGVDLDKQDKSIKKIENELDDNKIEYFTLTNTTALIHAVKLNHIEIVKLLVKSRANLNIKDNSESNALIWAVYLNNIGIVNILLNSNLELDLDTKTRLSVSSYHEDNIIINDKKTDTALNHALSSEDINWSIVHQLIKAGANLNNKDSLGISIGYYHDYDKILSLVKANADISDNYQGYRNNIPVELDEYDLIFFFAVKLEQEALTLDQFKNIDTIVVQKSLIPDLTDSSNIKFKLILSKRLASKFIQEGNLSDYHKSLLCSLDIQDKIEIINYILDKNYKRVNLKANKLTELKDLLLGKEYNFDEIIRLQGLTGNRENTKELITTYNNKIKNLKELIRKRAYVSAILSGPREKTDLVSEIASNISSYLNLRDLRNIK